MKQMTLGSLFDGIGGCQLAGVRNGIKPVPDWLLKRLVDVLGDKNENPCCV